jgi:hypothetical protein
MRALEQAARMTPGAWLAAYFDELGERRVTTWLEGPGLATVGTAVQFSIEGSRAQFPRPTGLAASNHPEKLDSDSVLLDTQLREGNTVYYFHHQNTRGTPPRTLEVRLENRGTQPMQLLVTHAGAGPSTDELYAGHLATYRYLRWMTRGSGWQVTLPPGGRYTLDRRVLSGGDVGCGMGQVAVLQGQPPAMVVEAVRAGLVDAGEVAGEPLPPPSASIRGRGLYPTPEKELEAHYRAGTGAPYARLSIGEPPYQQPIGEGTPNTGNYGVEHRLRIRLENPTAEVQRVYVVFSVRGGLARGSLLVDDMTDETSRLVETPVLSTKIGGFVREFELARYDLQPGEIRDLRILAFPEPGSNYPVSIIVKPLPANQ